MSLTIDGLLQRRKQRIALSLCSKQTEKAVDTCVLEVAARNCHSPLLKLFGLSEGSQPMTFTGNDAVDMAKLQVEDNEMVILYTVEGVCEANDEKIFCLDRFSRKEHDAVHAKMGRPIKYLVLFTLAGASASGCDGVLDTSSQDTTILEIPDNAASSDAAPPLKVMDTLRMRRVDCVPSSAFMQTKSTMKVASRVSASLSRATSMVESLERGSGGVDAESAVSDCCAWLLESEQLIAIEHRRLLTEAASGSAIGLVEAILKRYSSLRYVHDAVMAPNSVFSKLEKHYVEPSSPSFQRWEQRKSRLVLLLEQYRADAVWASMLSRHLMSLKLHDAHRTQSVETLDKLLEPLLVTMSLLCVSSPSSADAAADDSAVVGNATSSNPSVQHLIVHNLIPQIAFNLVEKCEALLQLDKAFSVEAVADAAEQQGYIMPLCTRDAFMDKFGVAATFLRRLVTVYEEICGKVENSFEHCAPMRHQPLSNDSDASSTTTAAEEARRQISVAAAVYAANRCDDIVALVKRIDKIGYGMMTPQVACLFQTIHYGAVRFPFLRAQEHKNWLLFDKTFDKTATLKYQEVEEVGYSAPQQVLIGQNVGDVTNASINATMGGDHQLGMDTTATTIVGNNTTMDISNVSVHMLSNIDNSTTNVADQSSAAAPASSTEVAMLREERAILSSRVTILTEELSECRRLLAAMQTQLSGTNKRLEGAEELNVVLMAEMRELYMQRAAAELPEEDSDRQRLIKDLAEANDDQNDTTTTP